MRNFCMACSKPYTEKSERSTIQERKDGATSRSTSPRNSGSTNENIVLDRIELATRATVVVTSLGKGESHGGTGFVLSHEGQNYIITNYHVVENGAKGEITIRFHDAVNGRNDAYNVKVLAYDRLNDLAILSLPFRLPTGLVPLELADISELRNGESVFAVGNPRNMEFNCIRGTVANTVYDDGNDKMSRILCSLNATNGNSGGAIVRECDGKVLGVATKGFEATFIQSHTICVSADAIRQIIFKYHT
jgi:S1-C subfamily serine protease